MPSLVEVRQKIEATKNTKKITKAMQLVAASKMKFFQKRALASRVYADRLRAFSHDLGPTTPVTTQLEQEKPLDAAPPYTLFVLLTSDKGLCGSMNTRLFKTLLEDETWKALPREQKRVLAIGKKAAEAVRRFDLPALLTLEKVPERLTSVEAWGVISKMLAPFDEGVCEAVYVVAPRPINAFTFTTDVRRFVPQVEATTTEMTPDSEVTIDYVEPTRPEVAATIERRLLEAKFAEAFFELKATEYSSRMVAMKKATDAADDRLKDLTKVYHKARQSQITQQLSELSAALEAMSSQTSYETRLF